jgi:hypothetical protein
MSGAHRPKRDAYPTPSGWKLPCDCGVICRGPDRGAASEAFEAHVEKAA